MRKSRQTSEPVETVIMPLDTLVPYWRNPRRIPEEAVAAVAESIRRYGYTQPIVVDAERVIIVGHTRYAAMRRLGVRSAPVRIAAELTPEQVKQLRVMDNRTKDFSSWVFDDLTAELEGLDADLMRAYFPDIGSLDDPGTADVAGDDVIPEWERVNTRAEFVCPSCFHTWDMEVDHDQVLAGKLKVAT
jgi:hypothetical protein